MQAECRLSPTLASLSVRCVHGQAGVKRGPSSRARARGSWAGASCPSGARLVRVRVRDRVRARVRVAPDERASHIASGDPRRSRVLDAHMLDDVRGRGRGRRRA